MLRSARAWLARYRFFVLLACTYAYFFEGGDPNEASRFFLTRAIVLRHAPDITPDAKFTIDEGEFQGKYYSDKAPGISLLAVVPYALMRATGVPETRSVEHVELHLLTILLSGIPTTLAAYFLLRTLLALGTSKKSASLLTFGFAFGTLAFPYATLFYGHALSAALVGAMYMLIVERHVAERAWSDRDLAIAGALAGFSFIVEYPTALTFTPLLLFACSRTHGPQNEKWRYFFRAGAIVTAGALPALALHAAFATWAYGSPFALPYKYVNQPVFSSHMSSGLFGIGLPTGKAVIGALVSPYRGLFFFSPLTALVFAGWASWIASRRHRALAWLTASLLLIELWFATSYYAWDGGNAVGPRHLVPALVFFVAPISFFSDRLAWRQVATALAVAASVLILGICVAVYIQTPVGDPFRADPLYAILVPALIRGEIGLNWFDLRGVIPLRDAVYNLGTLAGLSATTSLFVPVVAWGALAFSHRSKGIPS